MRGAGVIRRLVSQSSTASTRRVAVILGIDAEARGPSDRGPGRRSRIGPYRLLTLLGQGQMGVVFRARREARRRDVALKILRDELAKRRALPTPVPARGADRERARQRHVVPVVDFGEVSGRLYIAALYLRGVSLAERIASTGPLSLAEALRLASDLSRAPRRASQPRPRSPRRQAGERDDGRAWSGGLTDFGLARGVADTVLTKTGVVVGTVDYLAPELIRGQPATQSSDVYAFGCVLYECLAGAPPFAEQGLRRDAPRSRPGRAARSRGRSEPICPWASPGPSSRRLRRIRRRGRRRRLPTRACCGRQRRRASSARSSASAVAMRSPSVAMRSAADLEPLGRVGKLRGSGTAALSSPRK